MPGESASHTERLAIVGGGAIALGLATVAAAHGRVLVCTRTPEAADRARDALGEGVEVTCTREDLAECTFVVESIVEDHDAKAEVLRELDALLGPDAVLATTTLRSRSKRSPPPAAGRTASSACMSSNAVPKMELVELVYPDGIARRFARAGPDSARRWARLRSRCPTPPASSSTDCCFLSSSRRSSCSRGTGLELAAIDECIRLGVGHPLGPLALLDPVELDVAQAIGRTIDVPLPARADALVAEGARPQERPQPVLIRLS